jgi:predicted nucleic acid-binding protein
VTYLLDVSTLLALLWANHIHHHRVRLWESTVDLAVCPITELGFLRISNQAFKASMTDARASLSSWLALRNPKFIPCDERALSGITASSGGKTTDFYLAHLAQTHQMKLATLDEDIRHPAVFVIPR